MVKDWHLIEYSVPITEFGNNLDNFIIKGTAISETTTHNGHKYIAEELEKAAPSLNGRPLLVDHKNEVGAIKGKVLKSYYDPMSKDIKFEAQIMDKEIQAMVSDGRLSKVSIGAYAKDLVKEEDGSYKAVGIKIGELSMVAVPADEHASFAMGLSANYNLKESMSHSLLPETIHNTISERRLTEMTEENKEIMETFKTENSTLL